MRRRDEAYAGAAHRSKSSVVDATDVGPPGMYVIREQPRVHA